VAKGAIHRLPTPWWNVEPTGQSSALQVSLWWSLAWGLCWYRTGRAGPRMISAREPAAADVKYHSRYPILHRETGRLPEVTRLRICGTVLKSRNYTVQQYDLQDRRLILFNLGTWGTRTEVPLSSCTDARAGALAISASETPAGESYQGARLPSWRFSDNVLARADHPARGMADDASVAQRCLSEVAASVPELAACKCSASRISGGISNHLFLVSCEQFPSVPSI